MANLNTKIEWTDVTWSPVTGCTKVSTGCKHCYAERQWPRLAAPGQPYAGRAFSDVQCHPERLEQPLHWRKPRRVFVNSMSDLFHEDVPDAFIDEIFGVMWEAKEHTFQILTKRADRMRDYMSRHELMMRYLPHVWLGISAENQETAEERIPPLLETPAAARFVSLEPLLGPIDLTDMVIDKGAGWEQHFDCLYCDVDPEDDEPYHGTCLDWVIVGGESGPKARPMHPDWVRSIRDECQAAGVPFFFKQGSQANWAEFKNFDSFPADLQIREYPKNES